MMATDRLEDPDSRPLAVLPCCCSSREASLPAFTDLICTALMGTARARETSLLSACLKGPALAL